MQLRKATKQKVKLRIGISGPSGSGKTYSALKLAYGICGDWEKVALIDTENNSADAYADLGEYQVLELNAPYHPRRYIEAINTCEEAGVEVIIVDSASHEWNGKGGCLELHDIETQKMRNPNGFASWSKITPLHDAFVQALVNATCHVIVTTRAKAEYMEVDRGGKKTIEKVGMGQITRDGLEYELTTSFDLDQDHKAFTSKDRTRLFMDKPAHVIDEETGHKLVAWAGLEEKATKNQIKQIKKLLKGLNSDGKTSLAHFSIEKWEELGTVNADKFIRQLTDKSKAEGEKFVDEMKDEKGNTIH